jgi:hypothetical protein
MSLDETVKIITPESFGIHPSPGCHEKLFPFAEQLSEDLTRHGALLFRGFSILSVGLFEQFLDVAFRGEQPANYREAATPRTTLSNRVSTSTEYDPNSPIFFHNENAQCTTWPLHLHFNCIRPAQQGGATPIVDTRKVAETIAAEDRRNFEQHGLMYTRVFSPRAGMNLETAFGSNDPQAIEDYCRENQMIPEWLATDHLRVRFQRPAYQSHPVTKESLWFNHAAFYSSASLDDRTARLMRLLPPEARPFNVEFGNGSKIDANVTEEICADLRRRAVRFDWQPGDVLSLDNMTFAHGRDAFSGSRVVNVAMTQQI